MVRTWKCEVCGYIHQGGEPPEQCPVCGVGRELFAAFEVAAPARAPKPSATAWRCSVCDHVAHGTAPPERCPICGAEASRFEPTADEPTPPPVEPDVGRVIIVGGGIAALTAAEHARAADPNVHLTMISREAHLPYFRLNLTRYLAGEIGEERLQLQQAAWYEQQGIALLQDEVTEIDRVRQEVRLRKDGRVLPYDRLVLASGAHAFVPPIPGASREGVLPLRSLDDARAIIERVGRGGEAVCVGGGLLGLEVAGALRKRGLRVTVLEGFPSLLPRQLAEPAGRLLAEHVEGLDIRVRCGVKVEEILGDEMVKGVRLAGGEVLPADLLVLSAGVRPNSYLARQSGLEVKNGVIVDDRLFTSDPAILAAGDVAEHRGVLYGIWPAAYAQGVVAGANAVGGQIEFAGLAPSTRLKVLAVDLFSIGQIHPVDASQPVYEQLEGKTYLRLVCADGRLIGANLYGDTRLAGAIKEAVESRVQLATAAEILSHVPGATSLCQAPAASS
jgi:nitrite reductase (NADH) large subunit